MNENPQFDIKEIIKNTITVIQHFFKSSNTKDRLINIYDISAEISHTQIIGNLSSIEKESIDILLNNFFS